MGRVFNRATPFYEDLTSPPEAERVAWRMLAMLAACERGYNDLAFKEARRKPVNEPPPLPDWVIDLAPSLIKELQPEELLALETPFGMLSGHLISKLTWLCEGLAVLKWDIGLIPKPEWDPVAPLKLLYLEIDPYTFPQEAAIVNND